jgi:hypothetical protein
MSHSSRLLRFAFLFVILLLAASCNLGVNAHPVSLSQNTVSPILPSSTAGISTLELLAAAPSLQPAGKLDPPAATSCHEATAKVVSNSLTVCFLNLHDGDTLTLSPATPTVHILAEADGPAVLGFNFNSGEGTTDWAPNDSQAAPFRAEWNWTPTQGSKKYHLTVEAATSDKSADALVSIHVTIAGLTATSAGPTPTERPLPSYPAYTVDSAIRTKVINAYQREFGMIISSPAIGRKFRTGVNDPWVSTAFVGGYLYEIDVRPDGTIDSYQSPVYPNQKVDFAKAISKTPICKPAGVYSMLVVFLDFGNLGVSKNNLLEDLRIATDSVNHAYAAYPSAGPGSAPILQLRTTGVVIPPPAALTDHHITPAQIAQIPGVRLSDYQLLAQVDLDANHTARMAWGGLVKASDGYALSGCMDNPDQINIWAEISSADNLTGYYNYLSEIVLTHELYHLFGYPASHNWPCTTTWTQDPGDQCGRQNIPAMILGWTDLNGNGIPEILDPTPYQ